MLSDNKTVQVVQAESTQVTPQPLEFRPAWGSGITLFQFVG